MNNKNNMSWSMDQTKTTSEMREELLIAARNQIWEHPFLFNLGKPIKPRETSKRGHPIYMLETSMLRSILEEWLRSRFFTLDREEGEIDFSRWADDIIDCLEERSIIKFKSKARFCLSRGARSIMQQLTREGYFPRPEVVGEPQEDMRIPRPMYSRYLTR